MPRHRLQRMAEAPSESDALARIIAWARDAHAALVVRPLPGLRLRHALGEIIELAEELRANAAAGIHRNPPLVVYGNPPLRGVRRTRMSGERIGVDLMGQLSVDVHEVWYTHIKDGKDYHHPFDEGSAALWAAMHGAARVLYIEGPKPLWGDFKR